MLPLDAMVPVDGLPTMAATATRLEDAGFSRLFVAEGNHDPFVMAAMLSQHLTRAALGTGVAIAFARTPMTVAHAAWDLQVLTEGRFVLGLGSQVRAHITRRFSMPWSHPAGRMREFVLALRAIWTAWETGDRSAFDGEYYRHTLVGPPFSPGANPHGNPPLLLAGVGPLMVEVAGEVADGYLGHPFNSPAFVEQVVRPALDRGRARRSDLLGPLEVTAELMAVTATSPSERTQGIEAARAQVAFYGSTPAYGAVLDDLELHERLHALSREARWDDMTRLVPDHVLHEIVLVGDPEEVVARAQERASGWADRIVLMPPAAVLPGGVDATVEWYRRLRAGQPSS